MAPSANATAHGASGTSHLNAIPTASVVVATKPMASNRMGRSIERKSRHEVLIAAGYSTAGNTIASIRCGSSASSVQSNVKPNPMPARTSTTGYGTRIQFASHPAAIAHVITRMKESIRQA